MWEWISQNSTQLRVVAGFLTLSLALASVLVAFAALQSNKRMARRRATLDMLVNNELDEDYIKRRRIFISIVNSQTPNLDTTLLRLAENQQVDTATGIPKIEAIRVILDVYELISVSIAFETLDHEVYEQWFRGSFVGDWNLVRNFIEQIRTDYDNRKIYRHFEWLAVCWGGIPTKDFRPLTSAAFSKPFFVPPAKLGARP